jgi:UDP-N-acetylmuramoyl-L-alanyl-D-glutamate--2,6-diaminopimelate ligase
MDMVQEGIQRPKGERFFRSWDRRETIKIALNMARPGDLVLIAGKGHETTQEIRGVHHPFSDRYVAANIIQAQQIEKSKDGKQEAPAHD